MDAIYVILRNDTNWTLLYLGNNHRKIHQVEDWANIHAQKCRRVRMLGLQHCYMDQKFFHND